MKRIVAFLLPVVLFLSPLGGCARPPAQEREAAGAFVFRDALGRDVVVENPQRVAALMGSFAEVWELAGGKLAGVTSDAITERHLELPEDIPLLGMYNEPSLEAILALNPDFVILSSETGAHLSLREGLEGAGLTCAYFSVAHFEEYLEMLRICTGITGRTDLYESNGTAVAEEIESLLSAQDIGTPSVLLAITWSGGIAVQDGESMAGRMLRELGCDNLADRFSGPLREFSLEEIIAQDPDYLLVIPMGNDEELARKSLAESLETHPAWNGLSAVHNGQYHLLPKELFLYKPNRKWAESYAHLLELLTDNE